MAFERVSRGSCCWRQPQQPARLAIVLAACWFMVVAAFLVGETTCVMRRVHPPLARSQRQIITNELATGLSGTGTSFNSIYSDPFYSQQQSIYQTNDYDNLVPVLPTNRKALDGSYAGQGYEGSYGWRGGFGGGASKFGGVKGGGFRGSDRPPFYSGLNY